MKLEMIGGLRRLTATDGKYLTRDGAIGTEVWLSPTDTVDGWMEVDTPPDAIESVEDIESIIGALEELL